MGSPPAGWQHYFVEIDHEVFSTVISLSSADSRRVVVRMCTILVNCLED